MAGENGKPRTRVVLNPLPLPPTTAPPPGERPAPEPAARTSTATKTKQAPPAAPSAEPTAPGAPSTAPSAPSPAPAPAPAPGTAFRRPRDAEPARPAPQTAPGKVSGGPLRPVPELPDDAGKIQTALHNLRPGVITGGAPTAPLLLMGMLEFVDGFDNNAYSVLLPDILNYFGTSLTTVATLQTIAGILAVALALPIGYLTDRVNRVWMIIGGAVFWGTMAMLTAFSWTIGALVVFRFGAQTGKIFAQPQNALLADYYPPQARGGVFAAKEMFNRAGNFLGPILAGLLATLLFWQAPFLILGIPSVVVAIFIAIKLREPVRGEQERRVAGAGERAAKTPEAPPSWTESWRIAKSVRALRRIWMALPFVVGAVIAASRIMPLYYDEVFGIGPWGRGLIQGFDEPAAIVGVIIGAATVNRFLAYRPGRVISYLGMLSIFSAVSYAVIAIAPVLGLAIGFRYSAAFVGAIIMPAVTALLTLVTPPRVRGFALAVSILIIGIAGNAIGLVLSAAGDAAGLRMGLLILTPVYLIGAFILTSAGATVDADIRAAQAAALASYEARQSKEAGKAKLLVVRDLDVHYDSVQILFNVDFDVEEGEIIALLGTNGAGKSTLLRAISGTTVASNGAISFDGEDITFLPPSAHAARGIVQVPGGRGVFPGLTVRENLRIAAWMYRRDRDYVRAGMQQVVGYFPALQARIDEPAGNLSGGEQQMLTLAQAFLSRPRLLMIDELSLGLAPSIVEQLLRIVRAIHQAGTTIILVEQSVNIALTLAERAVFMEKGEIRFSGPTTELLQRPDVLRSVFLQGSGGGGGSSRRRRARQAALLDVVPDRALELRGVSKSYGGIHVIPELDLEIEEDQIVGLIGPNGAGKTTVFDIVSGFVVPDRGQISLFGDDVTELPPDERAALGLVRSFQDARLFPSLTVEENIAVALERHLATKSTVGAALHLPNVAKAEASLSRRIERLITMLNLGDFRDKFVRELSTGTRRIVDLACVVACDPKLLLLDEPSSGIAQREAEELGPVLQRIKWETGCTMLLIEHDMSLISSISDELVALDLGRVVTRGRPDEVLAHPHVVESYLGTSEEVIRRSGQLG